MAQRYWINMARAILGRTRQDGPLSVCHVTSFLFRQVTANLHSVEDIQTSQTRITSDSFLNRKAYGDPSRITNTVVQCRNVTFSGFIHNQKFGGDLNVEAALIQRQA